MTQEELQAKYDLLLDKVRRMRGFQKEYLKYHAIQDKERMQALQRQVDAIIDQEVKVMKSKQPEIFR